MNHLTENTKNIIDKTFLEKKIYINDNKWIGYNRANEILNKLYDLVDLPKTTRMPNILIVGKSRQHPCCRLNQNL